MDSLDTLAIQPKPIRQPSPSSAPRLSIDESSQAYESGCEQSPSQVTSYVVAFHLTRPSHTTHGQNGEDAAQRLLRNQHCLIWEKNWKTGNKECDIIASFGTTLRFVEVKTRAEAIADQFDPLEAVDGSKQETLRAIADSFLAKRWKLIRRRRIRQIVFDIVTVSYTPANRYMTVYAARYVPDAFR